MFLYLLIAFTLVPIFEIWLLLRIGEAVGGLPTIGLVLFTGVVGAALARREGVRTLSRINASLARGEMPAQEMVGGLMIFLAGVVLVTPGVVTDVVGFCLLIPPLRAWLGRRLTAYFKSRVTVIGAVGVPPRPVDDGFIDVEHDKVTEATRDRLEP